MLSAAQAAALIKYYQTIELSGEQKDRLIEVYWRANPEERQEIARAYAHIFASDAAFVHRLLIYHDLRRAEPQPAQPRMSVEDVALEALPGDTEGTSPRGGVSGSPTFSHSSGGSPVFGSPPPRLTHSQMLLRTAIEDQFPKLLGPGPFPLTFGLVQTEAERREVVQLYASQFQNPDPPELQRLVTVPHSLSTRTRRQHSGSYSWYIRSLTTNEVVCAVTVCAHHHHTHHFVEMPLFATGAGYKKNGFGRLLNAALAAWCGSFNFEFVMISADVQAIPFWSHLGYVQMTKTERNSIAFYYEHECYKFKGAEPMIGYCSEASRRANTRTAGTSSHAPLLSSQRVEQVLQGMPKFVVVGPLELPGA